MTGVQPDLGSLATEDDWHSLSFKNLLYFLSNTGCKILMFHILILNNWRNKWSILMRLLANKNLNSEFFVYVSLIPPNASINHLWYREMLIKSIHDTVKCIIKAAPHSQVFLQHLFFSDEGHFHFKGCVNTHNCLYWSDRNPHWTAEKPLHSQRRTV